MKLSLLRQLWNEYDSSWQITKWFYGKEPCIVDIKNFLTRFLDDTFEYELDADDMWDLIHLLPKKSEFPLVKNIKFFIGSSLLEVFNLLEPILDKENFKKFHQLQHSELILLKELSKDMHLNKEILNVLLRAPARIDLVSKCIRLLHKENKLTTTALNFLKDPSDNIYIKIGLIESLVDSHTLNDTNLAIVSEMKYTHDLVKMLDLCKRAEIIPFEKTFKMICDYPYCEDVIKISSILLDSNRLHFTLETLQNILKSSPLFYIGKEKFVQILLDNRLLTNHNLN